jgi:spermidine synthase
MPAAKPVWPSIHCSGQFTMSEPPVGRLFAGIFIISAAVLLLELTLTRIFDVVLQTNLAYFIVSSAIFGLGLGGITLMLWSPRALPTGGILAAAAASFAAAVLLLLPVLKWVPFSFQGFSSRPLMQILYFSILYAFLLLPFLEAGVFISTLLARHALLVHRLYFWDLVGAGLGSLGIVWLPTLIGPGTTLLLVAAAGMAAAALFAPRTRGIDIWCGLASLASLVLAIVYAGQIDLPSHERKRGILVGGGGNQTEFSRWDPVAKIDVLSDGPPFTRRIVYDGGSQSSSFFRFDGNFAALRSHYFEIVDGQPRYNSGKYVALAHWVKRDHPTQVLVIGAAGGQETLAALAFGAAHVDAVEMVCTVIEAGRGAYADFIGHIYSSPRVRPVCDEGRSFLRHTDHRYDIIQIHSNHTTSSIAQGAGGADPVYLQTVEAYKEYVSHLTEDGILQINYFVYPRMLSTAAQAWHDLYPNEEFRRHLVITDGYETMPSFLLKRSVWTHEEIAEIRELLSPKFSRDPRRDYRIIFAPGEPEDVGIPDDFFRVPVSAALEDRLPYLIFPPTDERPFYRDLRKRYEQISSDEAGYVPEGTALFLNLSLMSNGIPAEKIHLYFLGAVSILMSGLFVGAPLLWRRGAVLRGAGMLPVLVYFGSLGAGFIMIQIVLIYKLMVLIGFPLYTVVTTLSTMLIAAGIGSLLSASMLRSSRMRALWIFLSVALAVMLLVIAFPYARDLALGMGQLERIAFAALLVFPLGVILGMPFPAGISALEVRAPELIPWAWGINGFMTVVGSLAATVVSMKVGFDVTLLLAAGIYLIAMLAFQVIAAGVASGMAAEAANEVQDQA